MMPKTIKDLKRFHANLLEMKPILTLTQSLVPEDPKLPRIPIKPEIQMLTAAKEAGLISAIDERTNKFNAIKPIK